MSSSEEYLDSLLDSILSGGKSDEEEKSVSEESQGASVESRATDAGKAMSPDEIEEMLVSMGTLGGEEEETKEQAPEEDMEAMLAFMDEHNADETDSDVSDEDAAASDDFVIDDLSLDDLDMGESDSEESSLDENGSEEPSMDELSLDDLSLDDLDMGESDSEESSLDENGSEEPSMDELSLDDLSLDDLDMGESDSEESSLDENGSEELSMDELSLDDLGGAEETGDGVSDDFTIDELSLDDLSLEETGETEGGADAMDELSMDDLALEEPEDMEEDADGLMSEEDIDRLLSGDMSTEEETAQDFASEETEGGEDDDLSALLAGMNHDEDLSEINDLLEESDQGVSADDDMLAMLEGVDQDGSFDLFESDEAAKEAEGIRELSPEEVAEREGSDGQDKKEKKKRKKLFGKKKKGGEEGDEIDALLGETGESENPQEEKKPGFFARLLDFLLESDEDDEDPLAAEILAGNDGETGTVSDENKELLQELSDEDKKGKKKKKKKDKKGKKGKEEEEDGKKAKKPKKEKKKKEKKKKEEEVDLFAPPEKKLSKKKVITVFLFCGTIAAGIIVFSMILPDTVQKRDAHTAYDQGEYAQVYDLLYGKELSEEDEVIFQGSNLIMQINRKLDSCDNYINLGMRLEALNALITGVEKYQQILPEAENYNVVVEVNDIYSQILERLSANFGLSEADAWDILSSEDDETYTRRLQAIIDGESYDAEEVEEGTPDVLPEEEEIIERIGGIDGGTETEVESAPEEQAQDENTEAGEGAE